MNKKHQSIVFFVIFIALVLIVAIHNFVRFYVSKDYPVSVQTSCNPEFADCFELDPEFADFAFLDGPYAKVEITAAYAPACLDEHTCENFSCNNIPGHCEITYCSEETKEEGEICSIENQ